MTRILVDTSVWVDHFNKRNHDLVDLLTQDRVITHPTIIGEIACGIPSDNAGIVGYFLNLEQAHPARLDEMLGFVEKNRLYSCGCGFIDVSILLSVLITPDVKLWTFDERLRKLSDRFGVLYVSSVY